jgi:hypothetical protein
VAEAATQVFDFLALRESNLGFAFEDIQVRTQFDHPDLIIGISHFQANDISDRKFGIAMGTERSQVRSGFDHFPVIILMRFPDEVSPTALLIGTVTSHTNS